jgi:hypothetical protein
MGRHSDKMPSSKPAAEIEVYRVLLHQRLHAKVAP